MPVVNADGTGYELGDVQVSVDATLTQEGKSADAKATGGAIAAISPDDDAVNGKPWTSLKIVDALCAPFTAEGNPVTCTPVEGYPLSVQASWEPRQEGEGDPSPENVRPIAGLDAVTVTLSGSAGTGTTATLALPETIYGGTVDAERNTYTQTYDLVDMGTLNWLFNTTTWGKPIFFANISAKAYGSNIFSSMYKVSDVNDPKELSLYEIKGYRNDRSIYVYDDRYTSAADFKAAMAGVQLAYELAEPVENSLLSEAEKIPALPGTNTVYTDADAVRVEGRADPLATVQTLTARIAALEAAAEQQAQANAALNTLGVDTTPDQITALRVLGVETEE